MRAVARGTRDEVARNTKVRPVHWRSWDSLHPPSLSLPVNYERETRRSIRREVVASCSVQLECHTYRIVITVIEQLMIISDPHKVEWLWRPFKRGQRMCIQSVHRFEKRTSFVKEAQKGRLATVVRTNQRCSAIAELNFARDLPEKQR